MRAGCAWRRLKELLRKRLYECGWHDDLKAHCKGNRPVPSLLSPPAPSHPPCGARADVIKTKGKEKIEVDDLVREITPHGRASVPDHVKAELLSKIQHFISVHGS